MSEFDKFWQSGSWQLKGKDRARRHFNAIVKRGEYARLERARDAYTAFLKRRSNSWITPMYGSTFFLSGWKDYSSERPEPLFDEPKRLDPMDPRSEEYKRAMALVAAHKKA